MLLLTPGPVTTRPEVRAAMAQDIAPWDNDFRARIIALRQRVLAIAEADSATHTVLPLQGCGHFATEAAIRSFVPPGGRMLIPATGAYADRMMRLAREAGRIVVPLPASATEPVPASAVAAALAADPTLSHVGLVYSETSSGVIHDPAAIGAVVAAAGRRLILDAVSAFGALPLTMAAHPELDVAVFTANKCLEGMPGLAFAVARIATLMQAAGQAGSWSFDLADIHTNALKTGGGSFRFTPPAQVLAAFETALDLYDAEGGRMPRLARYRANADALFNAMVQIGLQPCLTRAHQGPIIMNIHAPADPAWSLQGFVDGLKRHGFLISNFYNTAAPSFRVGCIGALTPDIFRAFARAADAVLHEMGIRNRAPASASPAQQAA